MNGTDFPDRLNPIAVKELRQAVQGRFFVAVLFLLLLLQLVNLGGQLLAGGIRHVDLLGRQQPGREVAVGAMLMLVVAAVAAVPIATTIRLFGERSGDGLDLLFVTTLSPRRVVAGKLTSSIVVVLLLTSACAPFLAFTYFLRGVDPVTLGVVLTGVLLAAALAAVGAIFVGCLPGPRAARVLFGLAALALLVVGTFITMAMVGVALSEELGAELLGRPDALAAAVFVAGAVLAAGGLLFELSVALVTPAVADRARPVRLYLGVAWLLSLLGLGSLDLATGSEPVYTWAVVWILVAAGALLVAISARDEPSPRIARNLPRHPARRAAAFFFTSGSANGVAWALVLLVATITLAGLGVELTIGNPGDPGRDEVFNAAGLAGYVVAYALAAFVLQRRWLSRRVPTGLTWVLAFVLLAAGTLGPLVATLMIDPGLLERPGGLWLVGSPWGVFDRDRGMEMSAVGHVAGVVALLVASPRLLRQVAAFRLPAPASGDPAAVDDGPDVSGPAAPG